MRVCLVSEEYPEETNFGGIATYQKNVAEELVKKGCTVYVICRGLKNNQEYTENGVNIIRIYVPRNNTLDGYINYRKEVAKKLLQLQENNLIDIIETPDWGAETYFFEKKRHIPLVVRLHTPLKIWLKYNKNNFGNAKKKLLKWENKMIKSADLITCCSNALKRKIVYNFQINPNRIKVTPNPADLNNFYCDKTIKKENKIIYVGSLEQRKGVVILAKALNILLLKYPDLKIDFIGKDTNRNKKNISMIQYIKQIVKEKYHSNLNFVGQIPNNCINKYLNSSLVAVFPSLFDNFPYVVLEAMACGLHIVGSKNSGMVEMLFDQSAIYNTGSVKDLARKIENKYLLSLTDNYNIANINRVKEYYNTSNVCENILIDYRKTINTYQEKNINKNDFAYILNGITFSTIKKIQRENGGVANIVYRIKTEDRIFIVKKYNYDYNFKFADMLYNLYIKNNIRVVKPINKNPIKYKNNFYNVFPYIKKDFNKRVDIKYLCKLITIDRLVNLDDILLQKCDFYYENLVNKSLNNIPKEQVNFVLETYKKLNVMNGSFINHGDIQLSNILKNKNNYYLIDFDETTIGPYLYDYAVIVIKMFTKRNFNKKKINHLQKLIQENNDKITKEEFLNITKFYLCKILLEKFYLHNINKIDLLSHQQRKDFYLRYYELLKRI